MASPWPYDSLTKAPTNLKEAIDWVLRVTGRDGKKNDMAAPKPPQFGCLCFLAKAIKDLLYDAKDPGSPGPSQQRYWNDLLLKEESDIVNPVLTDLGLLSDSTSAASSTSTCAGGTEVIKALIDQLAQGLQKWVGWQEGEEDMCCFSGDKGIGKKCECGASASPNCCGAVGGSVGKTCHECETCGINATGGATKKCYLSAYCKATTQASSSPTDYLWTTLSDKADQVHLLARIFLGSVCLIWSGLSQLGWLTKGGSSGNERWKDKGLSKESDGLGSFMAAMGYDLDRLNGSPPGTEKKGEFVQTLLTDNKTGVPWKEFQGDSTGKGSVAEYYTEIYEKAKKAEKNTEKLCNDYPLLVLHILASGYFRAGSAGAKGIKSPPQPATSDPRKPRHPRTIREILYWLSALPYSEKYREVVGRMHEKTEQVTKGELKLHGEGDKTTDLKKGCITHYLMAACGYCPLVLIGIQGTIATSGTEAPATGGAGGSGGSPSEKKPCPKHKDNRSHRCDPKNIKEAAAQVAGSSAAPAAPGAPAPANGQELKEGQVCYGGYHLAVKDFGPLHGMYANGLYGFDMGGSPAQCLDQLRIYVYHCFYQLYFLRKQCKVGVAGDKVVLGWQSCRYGSGLRGAGSENWICQKSSSNNGKCNCHSSTKSPLMLFLCDSVKDMHCGLTKGKTNSEDNPYPEIKEHWTFEKNPSPGHFGKPPKHCPVPMGWQQDGTSSSNNSVNHFKDLNNGSHKQASLDNRGTQKYPAHCTGRTLSYLLEYYCDPDKCSSGTLVVLLRLLACITPTVPRTLGDLFGFYYYIVYIGGFRSWLSKGEVKKALELTLEQYGLGMLKKDGTDGVVKALECYGGVTSASNVSHNNDGSLMRLYSHYSDPYLSPLSGQQYGQLSPAMAGTYLSWLVYLIEGFKTGLEGLKGEFQGIDCKNSECKGAAAKDCQTGCHRSSTGQPCECCCESVVSCTGVLPVLYKYGFGYGNVERLGDKDKRQCNGFLSTLDNVINSDKFTELINEINQLIYTTRLPWIFVLTIAWLVAVLYLAFGAIWPLDWTHMRSHCRGWFRKGSLSPWEVLMVGKKKGRGILEFFGGK